MGSEPKVEARLRPRPFEIHEIVRGKNTDNREERVFVGVVEARNELDAIRFMAHSLNRSESDFRALETPPDSVVLRGILLRMTDYAERLEVLDELTTMIAKDVVRMGALVEPLLNSEGRQYFTEKHAKTESMPEDIPEDTGSEHNEG